MNINQLLPLMTQVLGRDYTPEVNSFFSAREAVGKALNPAGQQFVINNWRIMAEFMHTPAGQAAIVAFIEAWAGHMHSILKPAEDASVELQPPSVEEPEPKNPKKS